MSEPRKGRALAVRLHCKMLHAGVPATRHYHPALSRQPGATRSSDRSLRHPRERAMRCAEGDRSQESLWIDSIGRFADTDDVRRQQIALAVAFFHLLAGLRSRT
jgi:hypothetical protein